MSRTDETKDIVSGDDVSLPVTLKKGNLPQPIALTATVQASLLSYDKETTIIAPVTCLSSFTGADWVNGIVVVEFDSAATALITEDDRYKIEIQVLENSKKQTWFVSVEAEIGTID